MNYSQISILEIFFEQHGGCKCFFELKDGTPCQGWISRIEPHQLRFLDSGPRSGEDEVLLNLNEIAVETLAYWDEISNRWVDFSQKNN